MLFSSIYFIYYFLPLLIVVYFFVPKFLKNPVLLLFSLIFYSWGEPVYIFLMIFSAVFNYSMAKDINKAQTQGDNPRYTLVFTVVVNLFILCFFKYYAFFMDTVNSILGTDIKYTALALPIGISFYTFQALSYIFDVYRDKVKVQGKLLEFTLYLCLFPQLIAGPIVQYKDVEAQLNNRDVTWDKIGEGSKRFIIGLGKKVLFANNFGALYTFVTEQTQGELTVLTLWMGVLGFTLQIYFDFSGYSDMAIGLGKMFGFEFKENFNYPYISKSITEFWRRWHISLGSWFREYVYIPLGGNRVSPYRHIINLLVVWSLTGLWHGASWNFVVWGLYYCFLLIGEKYIWQKTISKIPHWLSRIATLMLVAIGWVFFSSSTLADAVEMLMGMFFLKGLPVANMLTLYVFRTSIILILLGCFCSTPKVYQSFNYMISRNRVLPLILMILILLLSTAGLIYSSYNPFLYFRF